MDMTHFYSKAGAFISHYIFSQGDKPSRNYIVEFHYEQGTATFDGRTWTYQVLKPWKDKTAAIIEDSQPLAIPIFGITHHATQL